jgi:translation initiation factor IF-3
MQKELPINNKITASELRVIGQNGNMLGVMTLAQALRAADDEGLDLVLISPTATPPVAKIIDYGKYRFELSRKEKDAKKVQKTAKVKEVQLSLNIQENEIVFKMKNARRFIEEGNKVKVCINRIKGRNTQNAGKGIEILKKFSEDIADLADLEQQITKSGVMGQNINISMVLCPKKKK